MIYYDFQTNYKVIKVSEKYVFLGLENGFCDPDYVIAIINKNDINVPELLKIMFLKSKYLKIEFSFSHFY